MSSQPSQSVISQYEGMGFDRTLIQQAWTACKGNESQMLDILFDMSSKNQKMIEESSSFQPPAQQAGGISNEDVDINKAIELSLKEQKGGSASYEPLNPEQRLRKSGQPIGLKNIGNTCYVNSLFQAYFMSNRFVTSILNFNPEIKVEEPNAASSSSKEEKDIMIKKTEAAIKQIRNLRKLFAMMIQSHKKYADPTQVLQSVVDDFGQSIPIGDQMDVTEYHTNFLSRIEEAFSYQETFNKAKTEHKPNPTAIQIEEPLEPPPRLGYTKSELHATTNLSEENSMVMQHFFGRMKQFRTFMRQNEQVVDESDSIFGPIILDIVNKELYTALEKYCNFTIDDYRLPNGETTKVEGNSWIQRPPEYLFMQLNRVSFDKESGFPLKLNDKFNFEKELYLDRFILQYKEEAIPINQKITQLRLELEEKEKDLQKIVNYLNTELDIIKVLDITGGFLQRQVEGADSIPIGSLVSNNDIQTTLNTLQSYKRHIENQRDTLNEQILKTREEINKLCATLNTHKYHLAAILVHDGVAGSGHYYSFNRNLSTQSWKRFNDIQVSDEVEENVLKESIGGYANISAYCLVYLADHIVQDELRAKKSQSMEIQDSRIIEIERQHYLDLLPQDLSDEVAADNILFHDEIEEFKFNSYLKSISDTFKERYDRVTQAMDTQDARRPIYMNSFGCYLKNNKAIDDLFKWYIIDTVLEENPKMAKLKDLKNSPKLLKMLEDRLSSLPKPYSFKHLVLSQSEEATLRKQRETFNTEILVFIYSESFVISSLEERWRDACYAAYMAYETDIDTRTNHFMKLIMNVAKMDLIKMSLLIEKYVLANQINEAVEIFSYLTPLAKGILKADNIHLVQIKAILNDTINEAAGKISEPDQQRLKEEIFRLGTGTYGKISELEKVVKDFHSQTVQEQIQKLANENLYAWREMNETSPSNQMEKLMNEVKEKFKVFLEFYNQVHDRKGILNREERISKGYTLAIAPSTESTTIPSTQ